MARVGFLVVGIGLGFVALFLESDIAARAEPSPCKRWEVQVLDTHERGGMQTHRVYVVPEGWEPFAGDTTRALIRRCAS
jgi:hypothetical protein